MFPFDKLLLHVGHHKTGTTWMQEELFRGSAGFSLLNDPRTPWADPMLRALVLRENFSREGCRSIAVERWDGHSIPVISAERLSGHPFSGGFDQAAIAERLHETFPEARVIIGTRQAAGWKASVYRQMVSEGFTGRSLDIHPTTAWKTPTLREEYFHAQALVTAYQSLFGTPSVLELPFETLQTQPEVWLQSIADFSGSQLAMATRAALPRRQNEGLPARGLAARRVANHFRRAPLHPHPLIVLPDPLARSLGRVLAWLGL